MRRPISVGILSICLTTSLAISACGDESRNLRTGFDKMEPPDYEKSPENNQTPGTGDATPGPKAPTDKVKPSALNWDGTTSGDGTYDVLVTE